MSAKKMVAYVFIGIAVLMLVGLVALSNNPEGMTEEGKKMIPIIFPCVSLLFGGLGISFLRSIARKKKQRQ